MEHPATPDERDLMTVDSIVEYHLDGARANLARAQRIIANADVTATSVLGVVLRSLQPQAASVVLERDEHMWYLDQVLDVSGQSLPLDKDGEPWAEVEDWVDQALSLISAGAAGPRSDDERFLTLRLP